MGLVNVGVKKVFYECVKGDGLKILEKGGVEHGLF